MPSITVNAENEGDRLDVFLGKYFKRVSRENLQRYIKSGKVTLNGKTAKPAARIQAGDCIGVTEFKETPVRLIPQPIPFEVIFYDEHIIVLNKPSGLVVHPGQKNLEGTLVNGLLYRFGRLAPSEDRVRPGIVHRLDKETSGLMMAARTPAAHTEFKRQFREREVRKTYLAVCHGVPRFDTDSINAPLANSTERFNRMVVDPEGKPAQTRYEVVRRIGNYSLVRCFPRTGRMHQIRVHMASIGNPVLCDPLYGHERTVMTMHLPGGVPAGEEDRPILARLALHSHQVEFKHPVTGEEMKFTVELPAEITRFLDLCETRR